VLDLTPILESLQGQLFTLGDLAELHPDGNLEGIEVALGTLVEQGRVFQPSPGLFWYGIMTRLGAAPPQAYVVISKIYGENSGVGVDAPNAANILGVSTQVPAREVFTVPYLVDVSLNAVRLVDRSDRPARFAAKLSFVESTILEVLAGQNWWECGEAEGLERIVRRLQARGLFEARSILPERLLVGALSEDADTLASLDRFLALL